MIVYKYNLGFKSEQDIYIPIGGKFLCAKNQDGNIVVYYLVDKSEDVLPHTLLIVGTGWEIPEELKYLDTVMIDEFVWHIFERI